jgi:hypothetical protein
MTTFFIEDPMSQSKYPIGSVAHNLSLLHGTWHDTVELFELDGSELGEDSLAGSPGDSPFENLVYIDFDGRSLKLTNVHIRGRAPSAKTFAGQMRDGLLVFDELGPGAYENVGMSGGPGILTFGPKELNKATDIYAEPDFIIVTGDGERTRHTVLYRDGVAIRTLTATGRRLDRSCDARHELDPRGVAGPVHDAPFKASIWEHLVD